MDGDFEVIGIDIFWNATKRLDHRRLVLAVFDTLVRFLQDNGLVTRRLLADGEEISSSFVIRRSDLTDEGFRFYQKAEQKWLSAIDRGTAPSDVSILQKALHQCRA